MYNFTKPKIELYAQRTFGEKFSATFDFISENRKIMLRMLTYVLLPLCLFTALGLDALLSSSISSLTDGYAGADRPLSLVATMATSYGVTLLGNLMAAILLSAVVYGLMSLYEQRENRLEGLTLQAFKPVLLRGFRRAAVAVLIMGSFLLVSIVLLSVLAVFLKSLGLLFFGYLALMAGVLPLGLLLLPPIYLLEDISLKDAIRKTWRYGYHTWGGIVAVTLVTGIIAYLLILIVAIPWTILFVVKMMLTTDEEASVSLFSTIGYSLIQYLLTVFYLFVAHLAYTLVIVGLGIQYGHAAEKLDGVAVEKDVERFEQMGDTGLPEPDDAIDRFEDL